MKHPNDELVYLILEHTDYNVTTLGILGGRDTNTLSIKVCELGDAIANFLKEQDEG